MGHAGARLTVGLLVLAIAGCSGDPEPAPAPTTLESVVDLHTRARGGARAIEAVQAIQVDAKTEEGGFTEDERRFATRAGDLRVDVFDDGVRIFSEALDRGTAWSRDAGDDARVEPGGEPEAVRLRRDVEESFELYGLHELPMRGHQLLLQPRERIAGVDYYVIQASFADGFATRYYLNPENWLIERERPQSARQFDADPRPEWTEIEYLDYAKVDGVLFPFGRVERDGATGRVLSRSATQRIIVNPTLDPQLFRAPSTEPLP